MILHFLLKIKKFLFLINLQLLYASTARPLVVAMLTFWPYFHQPYWGVSAGKNTGKIVFNLRMCLLIFIYKYFVICKCIINKHTSCQSATPCKILNLLKIGRFTDCWIYPEFVIPWHACQLAVYAVISDYWSVRDDTRIWLLHVFSGKRMWNISW